MLFLWKKLQHYLYSIHAYTNGKVRAMRSIFAMAEVATTLTQYCRIRDFGEFGILCQLLSSCYYVGEQNLRQTKLYNNYLVSKISSLLLLSVRTGTNAVISKISLRRISYLYYIHMSRVGDFFAEEIAALLLL